MIHSKYYAIITANKVLHNGHRAMVNYFDSAARAQQWLDGSIRYEEARGHSINREASHVGIS